MVGGMGLEGQKRARRAATLGQSPGPFENRLMAKVKAVEVADCVDGAFQPTRRRRRIGGEHEAAGHGVLRSPEFTRAGCEPHSPG